MNEKNLLLLDPGELPQTDTVEIKPKSNCLQEMIIELMNERKLTDADVVKATGIPWSTWWGWISGEAKTQLADENLKKAMQFFNVHLEYLVFGIGNDEQVFNKDE